MTITYHSAGEIKAYGETAGATMSEGKLTYGELQRVGHIVFGSLEDLYHILGITPQMVEHFNNASK